MRIFPFFKSAVFNAQTAKSVRGGSEVGVAANKSAPLINKAVPSPRDGDLTGVQNKSVSFIDNKASFLDNKASTLDTKITY